ncbi:hypothetical protein JW698_03300 [Candidatus Wolfebacteria bacterium]|nr:hypothetical protein [Candidatus Wolfebacteria bacterium]
MSVTKIPTPLTISKGELVTYDYTVLNIGSVDINNVVVTDNKCSPVVFVSGDTNGDLKLNERQTETWKYRCTTTLSQTTTNTVTATGEANGFTAIDTANATVVVDAPIIPPLINLVKTPNILFLSANGGEVTYTYTITNPGTAPLSNVSIIDNKCANISRAIGHPGDINKNNLLENDEIWLFTCKTNLTQTTTNIGIAEGSANGLTAIDFSPATVALATPDIVTPKLPNTGFPPGENNTPWNIIIPAGIFAILVSLFFIQKKQTLQ